ncbi:MAG: DNA polymerase III subunit alpha [Syntrophobacteraceae bacterium]|nr:DNA polymerase III subunit alpha [Syntrophobacteraceae bacterium]
MMWGASSVDDLCRAAAEKGFEFLALTDTNGFYGLIHFLEAARKHKIRPIAGVHLKVDRQEAVFLAKSPRGYELLCEMVSRRHLERDFSVLRSLPEASGDVAMLSADAGLLQGMRSRVDCRVEVLPGSAGRSALQMARELGIPPAATNAVHFAHPEDYSLHRLLRAIDLNRTLSTLPPEEIVQPGRWLKSPGEMAVHFPHAPEALAATVELARRCYAEWDHFRPVFPHYRDQASDHFALLLEECRRGIAWRYGEAGPAVEARLSEELDLIRSKGYVDYFLVVADIVRRRPIHCGRGSGAASLVSYLLGITHVDPIRHRLLFGRFLNPERKDPPDIDVDFPWDERDDLSDELVRDYGAERLAFVSNHVGFAGRGSVREVARVFGIPAPEIKEVTRRMSHWTHPAGLGKRVDRHPKFRGFPLDPPWPEILRLASRLDSIPRHLSVHCGGIILVPDRVSRHVPVQRSAKGVRIIQWEKDQTETAGLVKIDLLGNRSLAVIRDAIASIRRSTGVAIDYARFNPLDDPETIALMRRGDTMGVFYVESPAMRQLQRKTRRGDFEHLVIHSSIIRPAANRYIREYVLRLHGAPYEPIHPSLGELLSETYGVLVYQEDVVQVAMALAGFTWGEADGLRKVISRKSPEQLTDYRQRFFDGCSRRGVERRVIETVWDMFLSFAGYSFCKPHSASYALVSFKSAYLKAHYPAEFMAAVISNGGGYYSPRAYISEARRMGIRVLGPDVNESEWAYTGDGRSIRVGFQQLRQIRRETLEALIDERARNGPFASLEDFLERVEIHVSEAPPLVKSGALDALGTRRQLNRPQLLWFVESWLNRCWPRVCSPPRLPLRHIRVPPLLDLTPRRRWEQEMEALGFILSVHPLALYAATIQSLPHRIVRAMDLADHVGRRVHVPGWPITRKEIMTRAGESMEFVSFEDETAIYETVFFPRAFKRFCQEVDMGSAYLLTGKVESEFGTVGVTVDRVTKLYPSKEEGTAVYASRKGRLDSRASSFGLEEFNRGI